MGLVAADVVWNDGAGVRAILARRMPSTLAWEESRRRDSLRKGAERA